MKRALKIFLFLSSVIALLIIGCSDKGKPSDSIIGQTDVSEDKIREYANALYMSELYPQAIIEYQRYLDSYSLDNEKRANILYTIGKIYFERLHDYENSLAYYLKVKHVYPESSVLQHANDGIVESLERLQRSSDAEQALDEAMNIKPAEGRESQPGEVIAKIGNRKITSGDLKHQISQLPDYIRSQLKTREAKLEFLRQFVANELFYDAAKRMGLDRDRDVIEGTFQSKKGLMVQKYFQQEIADQIKITSDDLELYFKANIDNYAEKDRSGKIVRQKSFYEVREKVAEDLLQERQKKLYQELMQRMMTANNVMIYDDLVK